MAVKALTACGSSGVLDRVQLRRVDRPELFAQVCREAKSRLGRSSRGYSPLIASSSRCRVSGKSTRNPVDTSASSEIDATASPCCSSSTLIR